MGVAAVSGTPSTTTSSTTLTTTYRREDVILPLLIRERAEMYGDRPYLRDVEGGSLTYGQLHERALLWARALIRLGVQPGASVVTMLHNTVENYAVWFGIAWAGAIEVPINVDLRGSVLSHQLNLPAAEIVIADASAIANIVAQAENVPTLHRLVEMQADPSVPAGRLTRLSVESVLADVPDRA